MRYIIVTKHGPRTITAGPELTTAVEAAATGELHRIGWGPDMLVCDCTDGQHRTARRLA